MSETLDYIKTFARFPFALRRFLRHKLPLEQARQIVQDRMEQREENFLRMVERSIYGYPRSPYLALLKLAGCELADLRGLVKQKGLENALRALREEGVYVTFEEFKGRKPIIRNGQTIPVKARDFDNPSARHGFVIQTGGSTGLATAVNQDLEFIAAGMPHHLLMLAAWGVLGEPMACCLDILPGAAFRFLLQRAYLREDSQRWFSSIGWRDSKYWVKYDLATLYMIFWMRMQGAQIPFPQIVRPDQALTIARWIRTNLQLHRRCLVYSSISLAMRVCVAADEAGINFEGVTFRTGAEPITSAKVEAIRRVGARVLPTYGSVETGSIGLGCVQPAHVDDVHLVADTFALITHPYRVDEANITVPAFNLTSLLDTSSKVMLNYQSDDYGKVEERTCGCALERCDYTTHLSEIRSYSKLVGEGVTLIGNEMLNIIEHVLPQRFGGSPLDYQLMEQEDERGYTRLYLNISPRVDIADEQAVLDVVLDGLGNSSSMGEATRRVWLQTHTMQIRRMEPVLSGRGKLLPLHIERVKSHE